MRRATRPLRFRLFLLAASGLLPLALGAAAALFWFTANRERDAQQTALDVARALATAVEAEQRATIGVLQSLALAEELRGARLAEFQALARRVGASQGWRAVLLADTSGRIVLSSAQPFGAEVQPVDGPSMQRALATRRPVVGAVREGPNRQGPAFAVRVPVLRGGELAYVLSAVVPADTMRQVLTRQQLPPRSVVSVFDGAGTRVARSRLHSTNRPSPSLQALLDRGGTEGSGPTSTLEGVRSFTGFARVPDSRWVVATGISTHATDDELLQVLAVVGGALLASLALAAFLAWHFARAVTEPIDLLKAAAAALGRGEPVQLPPLRVSELQEVSGALQHASDERDRAAREREAAAAEREQLLVRATEALRQAEEAGRRKDEFLAMLGHELRNPLAPMATALHLMARKGDEATRPERKVMERQVAHMKRLVDDLLDVSRITGRRLAMQFEPLRPADVVRQAADALQPVLGGRRLRLDIAPQAQQLWVSGDELRLAQVLNNLLGNAVKFTAPDATLTLALARRGNEVEIRVADDGPGMAPEVLAHVFDLFYQAPQGAERALGGLGLGLTIVRSLVEMHGGSVRAESAGEGRGSCFIVCLPLVAAPLQAVPAPAAAAPAGSGRVLVVDDNQDAADTAAALLELAGYELRVAYEPAAALRLLDDFAPDVALLDIGLPGMDGYALAARLRAHPQGRRTALVALTGYGTQADVQRALDAGFQQHLVKPAAADVLLATVEAWIRKSRAG